MLCGLINNASARSHVRDHDLLDEILSTPRVALDSTTPDQDELKGRYLGLQGKIQDAKVDWYVVPSEDEHQSEEVALKDKRREWITGFTGSAGTGIVPASPDQRAVLFVDPRYSIQARQEVVKGLWDVRDVLTGQGSTGWLGWAARELPEGVRIGIDPRLVSNAQAVIPALSESGSTLVALQENLVDQLRDPLPLTSHAITHHPINFSGESTRSKLSRVRAAISSPPAPGIASLDRSSPLNVARSAYVYLLPALPTIAWLLNFRCDGDIPYCPTTLAYVAITADECVVFVDGDRVSEEVKQDWKDAGVTTETYGVKSVGKWIQGYVTKKQARADGEKGSKRGIKLLGAPECSWALSRACEPAELQTTPCPIQPLQALKNPIEQAGMRAAYLRDGRAYVRWISWLEGKILKEKRDVGEWAAAMALGRFRRSEDYFAGLAYEDISGSGPNGAIPHYAPQRGKDRIIDPDTTYVIDSGAQYLDGTIDTTRTLYFGDKPSDEIKRAYTRVVQGHMAVSIATFPREMRADWLNFAARGPLYQDKADFGHGLGHGVGSYMGVHEHPVSYPHNFSFQPGHVTTIEPGYYKKGDFGVRIESLLLCKEKVDEPKEPEEPKDPKDEKDRSSAAEEQGKWLEWERLTQVPIQTSLVDWTLTTKDQIRWLNDHNTSVQEALMPLLDGDEDAEARDWLKKVCKPKKIWPWTGA